MPNPRQLAVRGATGAVAGAGATWAMHTVTDYLARKQGKQRKIDKIRSRERPTEEVVVDRASKALGMHLKRGQRRRAAKGVKWALGVGSGVATAWARRRMGAADSLGRGALFGLVTFLITDELLKPMVGAAESPREYPWQFHVRRMIGHTTYGLVNAGVRKAVSRLLD